MYNPYDRPFPEDQMGKIKRLARDLAWFFINEKLEFVYWRDEFVNINENELLSYIEELWGDDYPNLFLLATLDYLDYAGDYGDDITT